MPLGHFPDGRLIPRGRRSGFESSPRPAQPLGNCKIMHMSCSENKKTPAIRCQAAQNALPWPPFVQRRKLPEFSGSGKARWIWSQPQSERVLVATSYDGQLSL